MNKKIKKKEPTIKDLKAVAFDISQEQARLQQQYNAILQQIVKKQQKKETKT